MLDEVLEFIEGYEKNQKEVMFYIHDLLMDLDGISPKIRYKIPFYYRKSWVCYLNPTKDDKIELAFPRGNELSNLQGLLEGKGRKQVRSMTFTTTKDIPQEALHEIIHEALLLDEEVPYQSKRNQI